MMICIATLIVSIAAQKSSEPPAQYMLHFSYLKTYMIVVDYSALFLHKSLRKIRA